MNVRERLALTDPAQIAGRITSFLAEQVREQYRDGAILGLSGGVDSALSAFLAVRALGPSRVSLLFLPEWYTHPTSRRDAASVAAALGVPLQTISIAPLLLTMGAHRLTPPGWLFPRRAQERYVRRQYLTLQGDQPSTFIRTLRGGDGIARLRRSNAYLHVKHRLRMALWYYWSEYRNQLVIGNCNLSEKMTGYFVRYGDSGSDVDPIAGLYKTQVFQLARWIGVPDVIVDKAPSPDMAPGMTDEFALQMRYELLDQILWCLAHAMEPANIQESTGADEQQISYVRELVRLSAPMRAPPPMPDLTGLVS